MKISSLKCAAILVAALAGAGCSEGPVAPQAEVKPQFDEVIPGPGEECYPEQHGPTCVPNANSRTGYAIAN